jgi:hypothetical protein
LGGRLERFWNERFAPVQLVRDFTGGKYLVYHCDRSARFRINQVRGDNAC